MVDTFEIAKGETGAWASGWRRLVLATGMLVYPAITAATIHLYSTGLLAVIGYALLGGFCVCYVAAMLSLGRDSRTAFWLGLAGMVLIFVAELWFARINAFDLLAVIVSVAVLPLRARAIPVLVLAGLAGLLVPVLIRSWREGPGWTQMVMIVFTALLWYAFAEIARANQTLVVARAEVARLASETERNRIARDLHDLVGHSLTAITVKSNLARQLAGSENSPSLHEITEIERLSRQALADVRAAVSGYREITLASELARARELLRATGITPDFPTATDPADPATQELFGWAVRESVTNVVRHSRASRCSISVSAEEIRITDDGAAGPAKDGNGLVGLRERAGLVGATVVAGPVAPRGWQLRVTMGSERVT